MSLAKSRSIDLVLTVCCEVAEYDETLSQYELAELCGCSRALISSIEVKALKKLKKICDAKGIAPDSFQFSEPAPQGFLQNAENWRIQ